MATRMWACAYLFGSRARGEERPDSDVDVAVVFAEPRPRTLDPLPHDLERSLSRAVGLAVDLVDFERVPSDLAHRVLRDSILLVESDASRRVAVEVRRRQQYFDILPVKREYREGVGR